MQKKYQYLFTCLTVIASQMLDIFDMQCSIPIYLLFLLFKDLTFAVVK